MSDSDDDAQALPDDEAFAQNVVRSMWDVFWGSAVKARGGLDVVVAWRPVG